MTQEELRAQCLSAISRWEVGACDGERPWIRLVVPSRRPPRGEKIRLAGRGGPRGEILCSATKGEYTCLFAAREVLAWLERAQSARCRICGCTDADCRQCIERTGEPCSWVAEGLCSACVDLGGEP